jgi:hypothetical protein
MWKWDVPSAQAPARQRQRWVETRQQTSRRKSAKQSPARWPCRPASCKGLIALPPAHEDLIQHGLGCCTVAAHLARILSINLRSPIHKQQFHRPSCDLSRTPDASPSCGPCQTSKHSRDVRQRGAKAQRRATGVDCKAALTSSILSHASNVIFIIISINRWAGPWLILGGQLGKNITLRPQKMLQGFET